MQKRKSQNRLTHGEERGIKWLQGELSLAIRNQHPEVLVRQDRPGQPYFFRAVVPVIEADSSVVDKRKYFELGPSVGPKRITKTQAEQQRDQILAKQLHSETQDGIGGELGYNAIVFGRLLDMFERVRLGPTSELAFPTVTMYRTSIANYIRPAWGETRVQNMKPLALTAWFAELTHLSYGTKAMIRRNMSAVFTFAERNELWDPTRKNPMSAVMLGRATKVHQKHSLEPEQAAELLAIVIQPYRLIIELSLYLGTRISEVLGLRWCDLNLKTMEVHIRQRLWRGDIDKTKTDGSVRNLAFPAALRDQLREFVRGRAVAPTDLVFALGSRTGLPPRYDTIQRHLKTAAQQLGLDCPGFGTHVLRRTNISWKQGISKAKDIETSRLAGHSKVHMTLKYTDVPTERQREILRPIEAAMAAAGKKADRCA